MTDEVPIPVAVVGAGNMGSNHVRVYDELPEAELVEVVEKDPEIAAEVKEDYDVEVLDSVDELKQAKAATVAVPNSLHREVGTTLLNKGLDVLIEKPLAGTVEDAEAIVESADENNAVLQVGHIERFNPAVRTLKDILKEQKIIAIEAHRLGPFSEQLSQESAILDLMIHDIDIVEYLVPGELSEVSSMGTKTRSESIDHVFCQMRYDSSEIASLTASHVTHGKIRELSVTTKEGYISLDYQSQDVTVQRRGSEYTTELISRTGYVSEAVTEKPYVHTQEPLKIELQHFLRCVRGKERPMVDGEDGVRALEIVKKIAGQI